MTTEDLGRLAELEQAATPGPWEQDESWLVKRSGDTLRNTPGFGKFEGYQREANAALCCALRNHARQLIEIAQAAAKLVDHSVSAIIPPPYVKDDEIYDCFVRAGIVRRLVQAFQGKGEP